MRHLIIPGLLLSLSGCAAGPPTSLGAFQTAAPPAPATSTPPSTVIIEQVPLLRVNQQVTAASDFVYHITDYHTIATERARTHDYWVMLGPDDKSVLSRGQVVLGPRTDLQNNQQYQAPIWEVTQGYARVFGWLPIAASDQVVAGGVGTSFILQKVGNETRVFLVNSKPGDKVEVWPKDGQRSEAIILQEESKYITATPSSSGQLSIGTSVLPTDPNNAISKFLSHVEARAEMNGQPVKAAAAGQP